MPQTDRRLWTKDELIVAFNLYLKIEFGKTHSGNPKIKELANTIRRTPASIVMRLGNFASIVLFTSIEELKVYKTEKIKYNLFGMNSLKTKKN